MRHTRYKGRRGRDDGGNEAFISTIVTESHNLSKEKRTMSVSGYFPNPVSCPLSSYLALIGCCLVS